MTGIVPSLQLGPVTYSCAEAVSAGQLVEGRTGGLIGVAAAGSAKVLGVAMKDGAATETTSGSPLVVDAPRVQIPVAQAPATIRVKYAAAATFGQRLMAAATGQVTPAVSSGTDSSGTVTLNLATVVGWCAEPAGVASGAFGLMKLA